MIKLVVNAWKKEGMTLEEFNHHWLKNHGALVAKYGPDMGYRKYIQSHKIPSPDIDNFAEARGWQEAPDGIAEVWWDSVESMQAALSSPEGQKASAIMEEDEINFLSSKKLSAFLSEEKVIFDHT